MGMFVWSGSGCVILFCFDVMPHYLQPPIDICHYRSLPSIYKLGYVKRGSTAFKVKKDGCGVLSVARALLGPEGLLMR